MEIVIKGEPEEIAALVCGVRKRQIYKIGALEYCPDMRLADLMNDYFAEIARVSKMGTDYSNDEPTHGKPQDIQE